jgi:hypothetical protein
MCRLWRGRLGGRLAMGVFGVGARNYSARPIGYKVRLRAVVTLTEGGFVAAHLWVVRCICDLLNRRDFDDFHEIEFVLGVFFAANDKNVFEALVIVCTIQCFAVAHTAEFKAFKGFDNCTRCKRASTLNSIRIKQGLYVGGVRCL